MTSCSTPSKRARSSALRYTTYSLGTYVRLTETVRCSSISLASLRASSTGRTSDRKTRPNVPSTRSASLLSRLRRTLIVAPGLPDQNGVTRLGEAEDAAGTMLGQAPAASADDGGVRRAQHDGQDAGRDRGDDEPARLARRDGRPGRGGEAGRPRGRRDGVGRHVAPAHQPGQDRGRDGEGRGQGE